MAKSITIDAKAVEKKYGIYKRVMNALAGTEVMLNIEHNANIIGSIAMAMFTKNNGLKDQAEYEFYEAVVDVKDPTKWLRIDKTNKLISLSTAKTIVDPIIASNEEMKSWMPFLACLQLSAKTRDEILWQSNDTTRELGVPTICEPFAHGSNVKNKLKKSRQLSFGPLVHLAQLKRVDMQKTSGKFNPEAKKNVKERLMKVLKRQTIGLAQKKLLQEIENGNWSVLSTLCLSYTGIKPHIEHFFALTYPLIAATTDFNGANMTDEWVWKCVKENFPKVVHTGKDRNWVIFSAQIELHCIFQTSGEDLGILRSVFGYEMYQRKAFGRYEKSTEHWGSIPFNYAYWAKPQKGAPRNINSGSRGQICSRPSLRGERSCINKFKDLQALEAAYLVEGAENFTDAINKEFKMYQTLEREGTDKFYQPGSNSIANTDLIPSGVYLLGS